MPDGIYDETVYDGPKFDSDPVAPAEKIIGRGSSAEESVLDALARASLSPTPPGAADVADVVVVDPVVVEAYRDGSAPPARDYSTSYVDVHPVASYSPQHVVQAIARPNVTQKETTHSGMEPHVYVAARSLFAIAGLDPSRWESFREAIIALIAPIEA